MRRAASVIPWLLLVLGSALPGPEHVHAAPAHREASGIHVDHVHLAPGHHDHLHGTMRDVGLGPDHQGDDAVTLIRAASEAMTKRSMPALAVSLFAGEAPAGPHSEWHARSGAPLREPPGHARPPGRAPPSR